MRQENAVASKAVIGPMPLLPREWLPRRFRADANRSQQADSGHYDSSCKYGLPENGRLLFSTCFDIVDGVLDGGDLLGVLVGDVEVERFLKRHHQFDDIERIRAQVVDERRGGVDLALVDAELLDDDLLDLLLDLPCILLGYANALILAAFAEISQVTGR